MRILFVILLLFLIACIPPAQQTSPVVSQPAWQAPAAPPVEPVVEPKPVTAPKSVNIIPAEETTPPESASPTFAQEDAKECWKDSDCGQDCASNYIMNVYTCDESRHKCTPEKGVPSSTVQCEQTYGYGFRCRVGKCMKGS